VDTNRLIRLSVAGWAVLISWPVQRWALGADFAFVATLLKQPVAAAIATTSVALLASPFLGLFVSLIADFALRQVKGGKVQFDAPKGEELQDFTRALVRLLPASHRSLELLRTEISARTTGVPAGALGRIRHRRKLKKATDSLEPYFNLLFHGKATTSLIDYATRRWTAYWMYANSLCGVLLGTLLAACTSGAFIARPSRPSLWFLEITVGLLLIFGIRSRLVGLRTEIADVTRLWLRNHNPVVSSERKDREISEE
jgi:hypothetical protein